MLPVTACFVLLQASADQAQVTVANEPKLRVHESGKIRVFYYTEGNHAVSPTDLNRNGIPDQVEDLLTQTLAAQTLFVEVLRFPDPFSTARFRGASFLDIQLRNKDSMKKRRGEAYDELQTFKRRKDPAGTLSMCFNVATSVNPSKELTPTHEFFHLIQSSLSYFKNRWYTEGTARWAERAMGRGALGPVKLSGSWPSTEERASRLFAMTYDASEQFWNPMLARMDGCGEVLPDSPAMKMLLAMTYVDGTKVLRDKQLKGWKFIREVVVALGETDDLAFNELGYDRWSEANQRSPRNDAYIFRTVMTVARKYQAGAQ
jgi:hypothetical protein